MQSESAFRQQQDRLKGDAIVAVVSAGQFFGDAQSVVGDDGGVSALGRIIPAHPVVVHNGDARDCEQPAYGKRLRPKGHAAQWGKAAKQG